jgi:hypothetical protein
MTAVATLAGAPSSVTKVHVVAPSVYREAMAGVGTVIAGPTRDAFERLEPDDAKVSRPVPRGPGASKGPRLPDRHIHNLEETIRA